MTEITVEQVRRKFHQRLDEREKRYSRMPAILGDGNDNVEVGGRDNYVYYRLATDGSLGQAYNNRVPKIDDLPVIVGYDALNPDLLQVLSTREVYAGIGGAVAPMIAPHHETHEFENDNGGYDVVWIQQQQIIPLMAQPTNPKTMTVQVNAGIYGYGDGWQYFDTTASADLSSYQPSGLGNAARFVGISIDPVTNALQYTQGDIFSIAQAVSDPWQYVPGLPNKCVPIAAILVTTSTTTLDWAEIYDMRVFNVTIQDPAPELLESIVRLENDLDGILTRFRLELAALESIPRLESDVDQWITQHMMTGH